MGNGVTIEIAARDKNVAAVLRGVSDTLGSSAEGMKTSFRGLGKESDGLFGKLKDLRGEARSHDRVFNFYGQQLAGLGVIAKGTGAELVGLATAMGSGMWAVAAVEAVKLIAHTVGEIGAEARKVDKEKLDNFKEAVKAAGEYAKKLREELQAAAGVDVTLSMLETKLFEITQQIKAAQLAAGEGLLGGQSLEQEQKLGHLLATQKDLKLQIAAIDRAKKDKKADEANAEETKRALEAEAAAKREAIAAQLAADKAYYAELGKFQALRDKELDEFNKKQLEEGARLAHQQKLDDEAEAMQAEETARQEVKAAAAVAEAEKKKEQAADHYASVASQNIVALIEGHKTLADVMRETALSAVQAVIQSALKQIIASALSAGAKSFDAEAGIPIVGPALGAEAMASTIATIMGLAGSMPSAAGGWNVTHDTLAMVHKDEKILPAETSRKIDAMTGGGGDIHVHAMDAQSFLAFARSRKTELVKVVQELAAEGRL